LRFGLGRSQPLEFLDGLLVEGFSLIHAADALQGGSPVACGFGEMEFITGVVKDLRRPFDGAQGFGGPTGLKQSHAKAVGRLGRPQGVAGLQEQGSRGLEAFGSVRQATAPIVLQRLALDLTRSVFG
jgi:hypothetical protein